jgi:putative pyruvate formate lyase activating enzyme
VYNSSGYESVDSLKLLNGLVDIYLPDYKYSRNDKALKYSKAKDYPEVASLALKEMSRQVGECKFDKNGIMSKGIIIRHLILPSNTNSSLEVLDYLFSTFPNAYISLMAQYTPYGDLSDYPELQRGIKKREYNKVIDYALDLGLEKIFIQDLSSSDKKYIPAFDFTGIM